jgi:hypothetical protein
MRAPAISAEDPGCVGRIGLVGRAPNNLRCNGSAVWSRLASPQNQLHLGGLCDLTTNQIQSRKGSAKSWKERMPGNGALTGYMNPTSAAQGEQDARGPERRPLGVLEIVNFEARPLNCCRHVFAVEQHPMPRAMVASPISVAEQTRVQAVRVGRFYDRNPVGRKEAVSLPQQLSRVVDVLDEIEHQNNIERPAR